MHEDPDDGSCTDARPQAGRVPGKDPATAPGALCRAGYIRCYTFVARRHGVYRISAEAELNVPPPNSAQPAVTVEEISDPTAANAGIELIDQDAVQLQSMPLRARRVIVRLGASTVVSHSVNRRVRTRTSVHEGLLAYVTFGPRATGSVNGLPVRAGLMVAAAPHAEARFVVEANWESITFLLSPDEIREHLSARQREREFHLPRGVEALQVDDASAAGLHAWGRRLVNTAQRQPQLFGAPGAQRLTAHVELVEVLLATIGAAHDLAPSREDRTRQSHSLIVKSAEDFALAQTKDHLYVSDLCRVAGVSERTLEYAFRDVLGLTPVAYLTRVRLHRVRRALLAAHQGSTTVSAEALNWGFWHFGEFSRAYKACFGELPSDTLRRTPGTQAA